MDKPRKCGFCKRRKATWRTKHVHLTYWTPSCGWCLRELGSMWAVERVKRSSTRLDE